VRAEPQSAITPVRITQAVDEKNQVVLKGNVHPLARAEFDQGAVSDAKPLERMLLLLRRSPEQEAALQVLLDDQQSKSSPSYHAWLTPAQFGRQFGPADSDIQTVTNWLQSQGFQVTNVAAGRTVIEFSGNAAQVRDAFHTEIHSYLVNGETHTANASDPQIPAALAPVVAGPVSLNNFPRNSYARILGQFRRSLGNPSLEPLFTFPNPFSGKTFYGLGPGDFATIYDSKPLIAAGNDGTGQTIAIVGQTNINVQDVQQFRKMFGLPPNFDATNVILNGEDPGITSRGEEGEADLDVEWSGAAAPGAAVKFVVSASTPASAGIDLSALYIVEQNLAGTMSESYGQCEQALGTAGNAFYNQLWEQAAAQGITVILSAGDGGSAGCDDFNRPQPASHGLAVSGLASTPFNVSVGGTDFDELNNWTSYWSATNNPTGTSANGYIPEIPWNQNCAQIGLTGCGSSAPRGSVNIIAGSGGPSSLYGKPTWQMGVAGMPNDNHRDQPDISLFASPGFDGTGYVYCQSDQTISGGRSCDLTNASTGVLDFGIVGGTSASAPAFAGIMALVNQYQATHGGSNRQGNANYVLYALANKSGASCTSTKTQAAGCVFNDVTKGNSILPTGVPGVGTNSVPCQGGSLNCSASTAGSTGVLVDPSHPTTEAWTAAAGYDMTTGLGTVNVNALATSWSNVSTVQTTTTLTLSPTTGITHGTGENVTVGISVTPNAGTGIPSGDVSLIATPIPASGTTQGLDHFTLTNGAVNGAKTQSLPGGTYNVSAHYAGDGTNAPSDSTAVQVTVGKESSEAFVVIPTFDSSGNLVNGNASSTVYGSSYIIRMYVTDKNGVASPTGPPSPTCLTENLLTCPSGTISLTANGSPVDGGVFSVNTEGYTRDIAPTLTGGTYSLSAQYAGDNSYQGSSSAADSFTVMPTDTQLILTNSSCPIVGRNCTFSVLGQPYLSNYATAAAPTGTLTFYDGATLIGGPVPVSGVAGRNGVPPRFTASAQAMFSTSGSHTLIAKYSGDANYLSQTAQQTLSVVWPTTITIQANSTTVNYGNSVTITAQVVGPGGASIPMMTGQIQFSATTTQIPGPFTTTYSTDASGNQVLTSSTTLTPLATQVVQATYSGDTNFEAGSQPILVNVIIPDFSLNVPGPLAITAGQSGTLQFGVVPATKSASPVTLSCAGDFPRGYSCGLQPATVNLANGATSTATLTLSPSPPGSAVMGNMARPKHAGVFIVSFERNSLWPVSVLSGTGAILLFMWPGRRKRFRTAFGLGVVCAISLVIGCGGGSSGAPPPPPPPPPSGPFATSTTVSTSSAKVAQSSPVTFTATVTGAGKPTGNLSFFLSGSYYGNANLVSGMASLTVSVAEPGIFTLTAQYSGDTNNLASTSAAVSQTVTGTTTMQVNGLTSTLFHSANVTVTVQ